MKKVNLFILCLSARNRDISRDTDEVNAQNILAGY